MPLSAAEAHIHFDIRAVLIRNHLRLCDDDIIRLDIACYGNGQYLQAGKESYIITLRCTLLLQNGEREAIM